MAWAFNQGGVGMSIGVSDYPGIKITGPITVCCWAKWTASSSGQFLAKWGADEAYLLGGMDGVANRPAFFVRVSNTNKSARVASSYQNAGWNHFAGVFDGANVRIKVNAGATEDVTGDATTGPIDNPATQNLKIGSFDNGGSDFGGWLQDVCIFNRALSNAELKHVMRYGADDVPGLQMYFKLNEPASSIVRNWARGGAQNNGTKNGNLTISYTWPNLPNEPLQPKLGGFRPLRLYSQPFNNDRTGTSSLTAAAATLAASGTVTHAYTGTSTLTAAAATISASGTVTNPASGGLLLLGIG